MCSIYYGKFRIDWISFGADVIETCSNLGHKYCESWWKCPDCNKRNDEMEKIKPFILKPVPVSQETMDRINKPKTEKEREEIMESIRPRWKYVW